MIRRSNWFRELGGLSLAAGVLGACAATKVSTVTKNPNFKPESMRRVLVMAVVRKPSTQKMLEDEWVRSLQKKGTEAVSSYTLVPADKKLAREEWIRVVSDHHFDAVIVSRLVDMEVVEKNVDPTYIDNPNRMGGSGGYRYYNMSYDYTYQPGYTYHKETAIVETRIFDATGENPLWSAQSKTDIEGGKDPQVQIHDFVEHMMGEIY